MAGARTDVPSLTGVAQPDLILLNDDDLGYAIIRFDERSLATLTQHIGRFRDWPCAHPVLERGRGHGQPGRAVRAGLRPDRRGRHGQRTSVAVLQLVHNETLRLLRMTADPSWVPAGQEMLAAEGTAAARAAEPGSDHQLAWAQLLGAAATAPEQLDLVAGLLDGSVELPGLTVDTELRWALLRRLAATGRAGDAEIDAELSGTPPTPPAPRRRGAGGDSGRGAQGRGLAPGRRVHRARSGGVRRPSRGRSMRPSTPRCSRRMRRSTSSSCRPSGQPRDLLRVILGRDLVPVYGRVAGAAGAGGCVPGRARPGPSLTGS